MTTPLDIITQALKEVGAIGVGETPLAEDANDAFIRLNFMLAQWQKKRYMVYRLVDSWKQSTGDMYYTVGPGGDFDVVRPPVIESAFVRFLNNGSDFDDADFSPDFSTNGSQVVDQIMKPILAREDYNLIAQKRLTGVPGYFFYDPEVPLGRLYCWPIPNPDIYSIHIATREAISQFTSLAQTISLPPEYIPAMFYNLAVRLMPSYSQDPRPDLLALAKDAEAVVKGSNAAVPTLAMPDGLQRPRAYNIYSDW